MKNKLLIIIDMQNDFVNGSLGTKSAQDVVDNIYNKILKEQDFYSEIIMTKDTHYSNYLQTQEGKLLPVPHCIKDTYGHDIVEKLSNIKSKIIEKHTFGYSNWEYILNKYKKDGLEEIILVGVCTDICVISNALILKSIYPDLKITVDASCCAGTTIENHKKAIDVMKCCQINIVNE